MLNIKVVIPKLDFDITLRRKITVIRGDSGRGKTAFTTLIDTADEDCKIILSDSSYTVYVLKSRTWYQDLSARLDAGFRSVYIIDDADFIKTAEFSDLFSQDTLNFYIIINRFHYLTMQSLSRLPFSVDDVFRFEAHGKHNVLVPYYNMETVTKVSQIDYIIAEDSNSGYDFFHTLNSNVIQAGGKDKVVDMLDGKRGTVLLLVDRAAFGSCFDLVMDYANSCQIHLLLPADFRSFEYMLLNSNLFSGLNLDLENFSNAEICNFASHERLYTQLLCDKTSGTAYQYSKSRLSPCYLQTCCTVPARHHRFGNCGNGAMNIPKEEFLFRNTKFWYLIQLVKSL